MEIYAKVGIYRNADNFEVSSPEEFAKKSAALMVLYPDATIHFVEGKGKRWPFIVGEQNKPQVKQKQKKA